MSTIQQVARTAGVSTATVSRTLSNPDIVSEVTRRKVQSAVEALRYSPNAAAGKAYFYGKGHCAECHSVDKDLAGIGSKYDPPHLQDAIFTAGGTGIFGEPSATAPPRHVTVELPSGEKIKGRLVEIDDFMVVLIDEAGDRKTIPRTGDIPGIKIDNPLQAHLDRVRSWEDRDLHDLTAYLATLK